MSELATIQSLAPQKIATWTNRDKSISVQIPYETIDQLVLETYRLKKLDTIGDINTDTGLFETLHELGNDDAIKDDVCGKCGGRHIEVRVRTDKDDNKYYEKVCVSKLGNGKTCWAKLAYGCNKKGGGLFSKKKNEDGSPKGSNGWTYYNKETGREE